MNESNQPIGKKVVYFTTKSDEGNVEVAMQWNTTYQESIHSSANNINTHEGWSAPLGLPLGADPHPGRVGAQADGPDAAREGREPQRRGRPRRADPR